MKERPIIENQIIEIIDRLKGLCHTCGLSNQAAEEEIVTSVFLYKYLSDNYKICAFKKASHTGKNNQDKTHNYYTRTIRCFCICCYNVISERRTDKDI